MIENNNNIYKLLVINPGSTSTKAAVYENDDLIYEETIRHDKKTINEYAGVLEQKQMREQVVLDMVDKLDIKLSEFDAVVGRGGLLKPIESGTYLIEKKMFDDLTDSVAAIHASALGGVIAYNIAQKANIPAYVVDPIVVDEMETCAKLTGMPGIERKSVFHALNQKAVARECAKDNGVLYENGRYIVAHMGGGISVGAHRYGRVVDVNDALAGEGPFTPERTGSLPAAGLIRMCFSGNFSEKELVTMVTKSGGMNAYLGTNDLKECERMIMEGDEYAALVVESMAYQVSKAIGAMVAVLEGRVDAIILTGGLAYSMRFTGHIKQRLTLIAPVVTYPGEKEMKALAMGVVRVLQGKELAKVYE